MTFSPNRIVTLTSNSTPAPYGCVASTEGGGGPGTEAFRAWDASGTEWVATTNTGQNYYNFGGKTWAADGYSITPQSPTRAPKDWNFEGSNDTVAWDVLDTQAGINTWVGNVKKQFAITNSKRYQYYRVNVSANNGDPLLEIEEIEVYSRDLSVVISTE